MSDDLIFGIVYIPPEGSSYLSPDAFDQVENEYRVLSQNYQYICLLGDFNSRTAYDPDFIEIPINEHELDFTQFVENDLAILDTLKIDRKRKGMDNGKNRSGNILLDLCRGNILPFWCVFSFSIQSCRSCYARLYLCQRPIYKILAKVRNSKKNVLKIVLIIVNINKDENKSLISNQFSRKNDRPHFLENYFAEVKIKKLKTITNNF